MDILLSYLTFSVFGEGYLRREYSNLELTAFMRIIFCSIKSTEYIYAEIYHLLQNILIDFICLLIIKIILDYNAFQTITWLRFI